LSYPTSEEPADLVEPTDEGAATEEQDAPRATRPRRRRGRRTTAAERAESVGEEQDGEPLMPAPPEEENSSVEVEPDLLEAPRVASLGVGNGEVAAVPAERVERQPASEPELPPPVAPRQPESSVHAGQPSRQRQTSYVPAPPHQQRGQQSGQRQGQQRSPRVQPLPPGVPSAAALDEIEPGRAIAPARQEPQGDLALLLRGFEEIQQRNTERLLSALRQTGGSEAAPSRTQNATERVGVFVDVPNLVYAARYLNRWIDFGRLLERLLGGRRLIRAHAYSPTDPDPSADQQFLTPVKSQGYRLTTKNYRTFASGAKKADMDLDLCMDVVRLVVAKAVECIVLCSGDGDFLPLLEFCADNGVRVEVASFVEATSDELRQACDRFYNLSAMEGIRLSRPLGANG
jgi:uncharacterized LabA/DUF88 family protein